MHYLVLQRILKAACSEAARKAHVSVRPSCLRFFPGGFGRHRRRRSSCGRSYPPQPGHPAHAHTPPVTVRSPTARPYPARTPRILRERSSSVARRRPARKPYPHPPHGTPYPACTLRSPTAPPIPCPSRRVPPVTLPPCPYPARTPRIPSVNAHAPCPYPGRTLRERSPPLRTYTRTQHPRCLWEKA